jgi:hypothetical protein
MIGKHRIRVALALALAAIAATTASAQTGTTVNFSTTFHEPFRGPCFVLNSSVCGTGEVIGLGQVNEKIVFGGGCGGNCDQRTITFSDGSTLVLEETASNCNVPGQSYHQPSNSRGHPFSCTLSDTVRGDLSTGTFANATGNLSGEVKAAGGLATIKLAGPIRLA